MPAPQTLATGRSVVAKASPATEPMTGPASFWRDQRIQLGLLVAVLFVIAIPFLLSRGKERTDQSQLVSAQSSEESTAPDSQSKNSTPGESWQGWPLDAPKPAIAPFTAEKAKQHQEEWAKYLKVPVEYTNSIDMKFVLIPPGEFLMGSTAEEIESAMVGIRALYPEHNIWHDLVTSEQPRHKVVLTQPIYLAKHEVTQAEYQTVMRRNPAKPDRRIADGMKGLDTTRYPVDQVSWLDAAEFCARLSELENLRPTYFRTQYAAKPLEGAGYRLPTEALWEFACRAGTVTRFWSGDSDAELERSDWFWSNSDNRTHAVGELLANPFGLYDMHGNVQEWIADRWHPESYAKSAQAEAIDPTGPTSAVMPDGDWRILRGASAEKPSTWCRSAMRGATTLGVTGTIGLRLTLPFEVVKEKSSTIANEASRTKALPAQAPEPPPLEEWLKGRTILTVAQDGSGQFKTINEAIQQLKSGQVIKVMDRGPYREAINLVSPPADSGLISTQETVVELPNWIEDPEVGAGVRGHRISSTDGFRLSGLTWLSPPGEKGDLLRLWLVNGLIMERCVFRSATKTAVLVQFDPQPRLQTAVIRECGFFDGLLLLGGDARHGRLVIENNYFHKRGSLMSWQVGRFSRLIFRHNVCDYFGPGFHGLSEISEGIELSNNTILAPLTQFSDAAPTQGVTIRNNIVQYGVLVSNSAGTLLPPAQWRVDHNGYLEYGKGNGKPFVAQSPTDVAQDPGFLSVDSTHRDYARIPADAPAATAGAGGGLPRYIGALPPGPAPKEGDWFTRLQERWLKPAASPRAQAVNLVPIKTPEPPPLAEWLKGRDLRTVAQDGSAEFKTIQSALDALQPGQVIKVLDRGPYRERLTREPIPDNCGLISEAGTVLELTEFATRPDSTEPVGHDLVCPGAFRLNGLVLSFPAAKKSARGLYVRYMGPVVFENCSVQAPAANEFIAAVMFNGWGQTEGQFVWVRDCAMRGQLIMTSTNLQADAVVEHNFITGPGNQAIACSGDFDRLDIRHNILGGNVVNSDIAFELVRVNELGVWNNTLLSQHPNFFSRKVPSGNVRFVNNLRIHPGLIAVVPGTEDFEAAVSPSWKAEFNAYPRPLRSGEFGLPKQNIFPGSDGDITGLLKLLSQAETDADYLRIPADSPLANKGAGGDLPRYIGALPPGPAPEEGDWFTKLKEQRANLLTP